MKSSLHNNGYWLISMDVLFIFPHQLFYPHPLLKKVDNIYLIEDSLFFGNKEFPAKFHKQKIIFHRATMLFYAEKLAKESLSIQYFQYYPDNNNNNVKNYKNNKKLIQSDDQLHITPQISQNPLEMGVKTLDDTSDLVIHIWDVVDNWLEKKILTYLKNQSISIEIHESPAFYADKIYLHEYFGNKLNRNRIIQTSFYIANRKHWKILLDEFSKPIGSKWTFDSENRKKIPRNLSLPKSPAPQTNIYIEKARDFVNQYFPNNPGSIENSIFPISHDEAKKWFERFLNKRFSEFGMYQDAIRSENSFLFHSLLSPLLNSGLLTPSQVINRTLEYTNNNYTPINSIEGFIRQILGWREFIRGVYMYFGTKQRKSNFFHHLHKIPQSLYTGTTGVLPVDVSIKHLLSTGYLHHIERLMILGNFMLLCEISPVQAYTWFMELFIDAYDWVMVPNLYGMSQYADGGLITSKPYISSSNYIRKMSNFSKGPWCEIWDGLYWRFIEKNQYLFDKNPRMRMMISVFKKMDENKKISIINKANEFLLNFWEER